MVLWQAAADTQPLKTGVSANVHLNGVVYAPGAEFDAAKRVAMKAFVGKRLNFANAPTGDPSYDISQIGLVTPSATAMITGSPPTLPAILDQAAANETITINGSNFRSGATVAFSGDGINPASQTADFVSSTQIKVTVSIDAAATLGARDVVIIEPRRRGRHRRRRVQGRTEALDHERDARQRNPAEQRRDRQPATRSRSCSRSRCARAASARRGPALTTPTRRR